MPTMAAWPPTLGVAVSTVSYTLSKNIITEETRPAPV